MFVSMCPLKPLKPIAPPIDLARHPLDFRNNFHRSDLWRPGNRAGGKTSPKQGNRIFVGCKFTRNDRHEVVR